MYRLICGLVATLMIGTLAVTAQPPGGRGGPPGGPGGQQGPGGGPQGGPPPNLVLEVLDSDGDHEISAREIKASPISLKKLDRNRDGKLTHDELHPGGGPGHGGQGGDRQGGADGGGRGQGGQHGGGPGAGGPPSAEQFVSHAMTFDADKDGTLNKREIARMAEALMKEMGQRGGGGHRPGGGPPGAGPQGNEGGGRQRPEIE